MPLNPQQLYCTANKYVGNSLGEYNAPPQYFDPKREIMERKNMDYKSKPRQGKFKPPKVRKPCFMDQFVKVYKPIPSPDKYKVELNMAVQKEKLKKHDKNVRKMTYIEQMEDEIKKHKPPGVGKYNLLKYSATGLNKHSSLKKIAVDPKRDVQNDINFISAHIPGPGQHNPHLSVPHLKKNSHDYKFFKHKHEEQEKKMKRSLSAKMGPNTYKPVAYDTFDAITRATSGKEKARSLWVHGDIQVRKGAIAGIKKPGPGSHNLINQWVKHTNPKDTNFGDVKLLTRLSKTASTGMYSFG